MKFYCLVVVILLMSCSVMPAMSTAEKVELTLAGWFGAADNDVLQPFLRTFEAENPGIVVKVITGYQLDKMLTALAANSAPDIFAAHGGWYSDLARQKALQPLDNLMKVVGMSEKALAPGYDKLGVINGMRYAVPFLDCAPNYALVYNATIFAEAGLPALAQDAVPKWDVIGQYHRKLVIQASDGRITRLGFNPFENPQNASYSFEAFFDAPLYDKNNRPTIATPEMTNAFETVYGNFIEPIGAQRFWENRSLTFEKRQVVMHTSGGLLLGNRLATSLPNDNIGAAWVPHINGARIQRMRGWALTIAAQSKHPVEAMRLISFLTTDPRVLDAIWEIRGRFGVGLAFLQAKAKSATPLERWFIQTLFDADHLILEDMTPMKTQMETLVGEARDAFFSGKMPAREALRTAQDKAMIAWAELQ